MKNKIESYVKIGCCICSDYIFISGEEYYKLKDNSVCSRGWRCKDTIYYCKDCFNNKFIYNYKNCDNCKSTSYEINNLREFICIECGLKKEL